VTNDDQTLSTEQPARSAPAHGSQHSRLSPLASSEALALASLGEAWLNLTWAERLSAFKKLSRGDAEELFLGLPAAD